MSITNLYVKDFIKCSPEISYITLQGITLFGWIFEGSSDLQILAR